MTKNVIKLCYKNMSSQIHNILLIGAGSKIGQAFLQKNINNKNYQIFNVYSYRYKLGDNEKNSFQVDLSSQVSLDNLLNNLKDINFNVIIFLSSTFEADNINKKLFWPQLNLDLSVNSMSLIYLLQNINLADQSKVLLFGDLEIKVPKKGFSSYFYSKVILEEVTKILAVELAPKASVNMIRLGPIVYRKKEKNIYYDKTLLAIKNPLSGLLNLIDFIINCTDLSMTGAIIDYDGGAYLKRN